MVAHAIGDVVSGEYLESEVVSSSPTVGGLLDSLTGSIGISSISTRSKPMVAPVAASNVSGAAAIGAVTSDTAKSADKDAFRTFISSSMPFGWYFLLWYFPFSIFKYYYHYYYNKYCYYHYFSLILYHGNLSHLMLEFV